jgi:hypothetical protein
MDIFKTHMDHMDLIMLVGIKNKTELSQFKLNESLE